MLTLIKREIVDRKEFFVFGVMYLIVSVFFLSVMYNEHQARMSEMPFTNVLLLSLVSLPFLSYFAGLCNSLGDIRRKYSSYILSLAITRNTLFLTKIVVGLIFTLMLVLPITGFYKYYQIAVLSASVKMLQFWFVLIELFLVYFASYILGLCGGFRSLKFQYAGVLLIFLTLIFTKGFSVFVVVMLAVLCFCLLVILKQSFNKMPL